MFKTHMHHSLVTGKILGYVHDFASGDFLKIQLSLFILCITFSVLICLFFIQGFKATACNVKDFNIGGTGSRNINFASII